MTHALNILSFNVRLFNFYESKDAQNNIQETFSSFLEKENPDVLCLQEYNKKNKIDFSEFPYRYIHFRGKNILGHAIFSKYPLINTYSFDFEDSPIKKVSRVVTSLNLFLRKVHISDIEALSHHAIFPSLKRFISSPIVIVTSFTFFISLGLTPSLSGMTFAELQLEQHLSFSALPFTCFAVVCDFNGYALCES